jgi:NADPH2:quinone reductase
MTKIRIVLVDPSAPGHVRLGTSEPPSPDRSEALIRVAATSLNRGELRRAASGPAGRGIGWDFAGTVEAPAADGSGPTKGARVVGMLANGAWSELIAAPTEALGVLPEAVSFTDAATLPVAGLTALYGLEKGGFLLGKKVLITGGTGGVGYNAIQIARAAGAHVVATIRNEAKSPVVRDAGAHDVVASEDPNAIRAHGPYDVVLDGVGGPALGVAMTSLAKDGTCVVYGATAAPDVTFNAPSFYPIGGATLYGFILFHELRRRPAGVGLTRLAGMVAKGTLRPLVEVVAPLVQIGEVSKRLIDRAFVGKAVVTF